MSQSSPATGIPRSRQDLPESETVLDAESDVQSLLDALDDPDCRAILDATSDEALSATEISDRCDLPLSTAYRKLDILTEAGLIKERTRIRRSGKHPSEYVRLVEDVVVSVSPDGGVELTVSRRESMTLSPQV